MTLPHTLKRIRLHLARSKEFPSGSGRHGYEFVAPLDQKGHIDAAVMAEVPRALRREAILERRGGPNSGWLVHKPGGAEHARWVFDYDASTTDDDEAGYRFGGHAFTPGEYVSICDDDDELHTFQVISVEAAA